MLGANAIVGAAGAIATGAAWAAPARRGRDTVGVSFFGDGAVNEGMLLEAFNLAALWRVPVLFVCENNGYATTMPVAGAVAGTITGRAAAFGIPAVARRRPGPRGGTRRRARRRRPDARRRRPRAARVPAPTASTPTTPSSTRYASTTAPPDEVADGRARDPVRIQGARLPDADRAAVDAEVEAILDAAVRFALASPEPDPADALDHLYASGLTARTGGGC